MSALTVVAWKEWLNSEDGRLCADAIALETPGRRDELINRLWRAFLAGAIAAEKYSVPPIYPRKGAEE